MVGKTKSVHFTLKDKMVYNIHN